MDFNEAMNQVNGEDTALSSKADRVNAIAAELERQLKFFGDANVLNEFNLTLFWRAAGSPTGLSPVEWHAKYAGGLAIGLQEYVQRLGWDYVDILRLVVHIPDKPDREGWKHGDIAAIRLMAMAYHMYLSDEIIAS